MSHAAFLHAIRETPDADLPRLVYADWLDENGDPARAEFLRVQCELATRPDHDPLYRELEDREHELLSEHEPAWAGELPKYATEWEWRRGFVEEFAATCGRLSRIASEVTAAHPVRHVRCTGHEVDDYTSYPTDWLEADWLPGVESLSVGGVNGSYDGLIALFTSGKLIRLRDLDFTSDRRGTDVCRVLSRAPLNGMLRSLRFGHAPYSWPTEFEVDFFVDLFKRSPLERLAAFDSGIESTAIGKLLAAPFADTLTHLDISGNPLAPDAYRRFADARPGMRLQSLDVSGTPLAGISLEPLLDTRATESLTKLEMNGCGSARRNMEVLSRSRFWTQATELRAHSGTIPASTLEPLCGSSGPTALRLLDLADNYLRTEGVRMLCDAPWSEPLTWLALSRNYLDDDSCPALANSRLRNLRTLHLAHNNLRQDRSDGEVITDIGVSWLTDSPALANLRLLTLNSTGISDRSVDLVLNRAAWRLYGLGVAGNNLTGEAVRILATSPRLSRLFWLDLSGNPRLGGRVLLPLAESPSLSRMCELDCGGIPMADDVRAAFRARLGPRFSD